MKKRIWFMFILCILLCFQPGILAGAKEKEPDTRISEAVSQAIRVLKKDLHPEYSKKTYAYPKKSEYQKLNTRQKKIYNELYKKITGFEDFSYSAKKYGYDYLDTVYYVWGSILKDYPEIENYFTFYENNDKDGILRSLDSRYYCSWDMDAKNVSKKTVKAAEKEFEEAADYIVKKMPKNLSAYDKYRYLSYVISLLTEYNYWEKQASDSNPYGALIYGKSICQGYAQAMCYLCRKADQYCVMAEGSSNGVAHAWNLVKLSTGTYHVDITWADERGSIGDKFWMPNFMLTQNEIEADSHVVDPGYEATGKLNYNAYLSKYTDIPEKGKKYTDSASGGIYRVTSSNLEKLQVEYYRPASKKKTQFTIPKTIRINGNTFKVTGIAAKAFLNCSSMKKLVIRTPYLQKIGADALKGIYRKAEICVPVSKCKAYQTLLKNKGQKNTVKIVRS